MSTATIRQDGTWGGPIGWSIIGLLALLLGIGILAIGPLAVLGLFGLLVFMAFMRFPILGLYATTAMLLLQGNAGVLEVVNPDAPVAITLAQIVGLAAMAAWVVSLLVRKLPITWNAPVFLIVAYVAWAFIGSLVSEYTETEIPHWFRLFTRLMFFLLAVNLLNTPLRVRWYILVIGFCTFFMSLTAIYQVFADTARSDYAALSAGAIDAAYVDQESLQGEAAVRAAGRAGHSNWLAMIILLVLPLYLYWTQETHRLLVRIFIYTSLTVGVIALILTYTRTGFIIGILLVALLLSKRLMVFSTLRVMAALLLVVVAWVLLPGPYKERVLDPTQYTQSKSVQSRLDLQEAAIRYSAQNPVFGLGIGGFGEHFVEENSHTAGMMDALVRVGNWNPVFIGTHNMYLQLTADTGLVGFFLFAFFFYRMLKKLIQYEDLYRSRGDKEGEIMAASLWVSLFGFAICAIFLHALQQHIWWMIAAAAVAIPLHDIDFRRARELGFREKYAAHERHQA